MHVEADIGKGIFQMDVHRPLGTLSVTAFYSIEKNLIGERPLYPDYSVNFRDNNVEITIFGLECEGKYVDVTLKDSTSLERLRYSSERDTVAY